MSNAHFGDLLAEAVGRKNSILVVGLDPQLRFMPHHLIRAAYQHFGPSNKAVGEIFFAFNREIIDRVAPYAVAVKPQFGFYLPYGSDGIWALEQTNRYAKDKGLIVITDAKPGDGSDTADAYADGHIGAVPFFDGADGLGLTQRPGPLRVDAVTVNPYPGDACVTRFVRAVKEFGTGIFVVDKTSFKPNSRVEQLVTESGLKVWQQVAGMVDEWGVDTEGDLGYRSVGVVLGATYPEDAPWMRQRLPNSWFLVPGYGGQGGTAQQAVVAANADGLGCVVNSSRGIINAYLSDKYRCQPDQFAMAAKLAAEDARNELNEALNKR
jgi:orotidine-5'-phosphate decarboxylase